MKKEDIPICRMCPYMHIRGRAYCNGNNDGNPRGSCVCNHPEAVRIFHQVCSRSPRMAGFIGYTPMGGDKPQIKTSPRWCTLRLQAFSVEQENQIK